MNPLASLAVRRAPAPAARRTTATKKPAYARPSRAARSGGAVRVAALGPGGEDNPDSTPPKKVLRREEEPDQGWISPQERKGANPLKDPAAIIGIVAIFLPFVILGIAIATGVVEIPER